MEEREEESDEYSFILKAHFEAAADLSELLFEC